MPSVVFILLASAAFFGAVALASVGLWNLYLERFLVDAQQQGRRESFLQSLKRVVLSRVSSFNRRTFPKSYQQRITRTLLTAGNPAGLEAPEFIGLQEVSFACFTLFGAFLAATVALRYEWIPAFMLLGAMYPWIWLNDQVKKRHHAIARALPYNLDLLTLSVEAGLDFAQALGKVCEKGRPGPLADELKLVLRNIKLGMTREDSLRSLGDRVQLAPLVSFVNALIQADRMGTSLGKVLRIQSTQLRIDRTHRAEKLANEAPVKMLFPLIACIFPTVFMILFGPIIFSAIFGNN
jgi:tight adherence protein C